MRPARHLLPPVLRQRSNTLGTPPSAIAVGGVLYNKVSILAVSLLPALSTLHSTPHPRFPHLSHREQNRPPTHFSLLILHIRKPPTCPTLPSTPHPRFPHLSHREQNRPPTHFFLLMCNIRKKYKMFWQFTSVKSEIVFRIL